MCDESEQCPSPQFMRLRRGAMCVVASVYICELCDWICVVVSLYLICVFVYEMSLCVFFYVMLVNTAIFKVSLGRGSPLGGAHHLLCHSYCGQY